MTLILTVIYANRVIKNNNKNKRLTTAILLFPVKMANLFEDESGTGFKPFDFIFTRGKLL